MAQEPVEIAIGIVWHEGRVLITKRPTNTHLGGLWEFPGGKRRPGEGLVECLAREVREEVGLEIEAGEPLAPVEYAYPDRTVRLYPLQCLASSDNLALRGCAEARWVLPTDLSHYRFPEANAPLLRLLAAGDLGPPAVRRAG